MWFFLYDGRVSWLDFYTWSKHYVFIINGIGIKLYTVINDQYTHMFYYISLFKKLDQIIKTNFNYNVLKNVYMIVDSLF